MLAANILQLGTAGVTDPDSEFDSGLLFGAKIRLEIEKENWGRFSPS